MHKKCSYTPGACYCSSSKAPGIRRESPPRPTAPSTTTRAGRKSARTSPRVTRFVGFMPCLLRACAMRRPVEGCSPLRVQGEVFSTLVTTLLATAAINVAPPPPDRCLPAWSILTVSIVVVIMVIAIFITIVIFASSAASSVGAGSDGRHPGGQEHQNQQHWQE